MAKKVGIVILNYNTANDTLICLDSIQAFRIRFDELVIVDNHSTHESMQPLRTIKHPKIILLESERNLGFAGGMNVGISYLRKRGIDTILCLNSDTRMIAQDFMDKMLDEVQKGVGVVGINGIISDGVDIIGGIKEDNSVEFLIFHIWESLCRKWHFYWPFQYKERKTSTRFQGCAFMLAPDYFGHYPRLWGHTFLYREENIILKLCDKAGLKCSLAATEIYHQQGRASKQDFANYSRKKRNYEIQSAIQQLIVSVMPKGAIRLLMEAM